MATPGPGRTRLVLASASPARTRLLTQAGIRHDVLVSGVDEDSFIAATPAALAAVLARAKAGAVAADVGDGLVLGCDSLLERGGRAFGKPADAAEATAWWRERRGSTGVLHSGHALLRVERGEVVAEAVEVASTTVRFGSPDDAELAAYLGTGEPLAVAGAFTIDGYGAAFLDGVDGDPGTVIGLSLPLLRSLLARLDVALTDLWAAPE